MIILFKGDSFEDEVSGQLNYLVQVDNGNKEVDLSAIKSTINDVRDYVEEVLNDEDSDEYDEVEMWAAYEYIEEIMNRLGYTYDFLDDELISTSDDYMSDDRIEAVVEI